VASGAGSAGHDEMSGEPEGGDAACWAHLFADVLGYSEDVATNVAPADLAGIASAAAGQGPVWTHESADLDVNLLVFPGGEGVPEHVNDEVDVLLVGIAGEGVVDIDGTASPLCAGHAVIVPKGTRRGTRGVSDRFAYLSCYRRRSGLRPRV
jgi:quercetin dioxygenase-like cupin family protein